MKNLIFATLVAAFAVLSMYSQGPQDVVDDGFTWFEAPVAEVLTGNGIPTSQGWMLKSYVRVFGEYPAGSKIKFVVAKAGKTTGTTVCETSQYHRTARDVDYSYMWTVDCWQKQSTTKETGMFDVGVFAVNGSTGAETLVRTYKLDVRSINRVPSGQGAGTAPPVYMINRHNEAPVSFMYLRPTNYIPYFDYAQRPERSGQNQVELHFSVSPPDMMNALPATTFSCTVDGKPLTLPGPGDYATEANMKYVQNAFAVYQDRLAPKYKAGIPYEEKMWFQMVRILVPLSWGGDRRSGRLLMEDHPGAWQCRIEKNGETWRTWRWTIGRDGRPVMHAEQRSNVNLGFNTYLIDMEIPPGGAPMDGRLAGPSTSLFYGQPWTSPEGRAMAGRVPVKGKAFPVPSTSVR
jgi:hypothetical protein